MDKIQDIRAFEEIIYKNMIDYLNNKDLFPVDAVMLINNETMDIVINAPTNTDNVDQIPLSELNSTIENNIKVDCDTINKLAHRYFFAR